MMRILSYAVLLYCTFARADSIAGLLPRDFTADVEASDAVHHFLSRPDIKPAKWQVKIYNKEQLAPGYWFVAPKHGNEIATGNRIPSGSWIGPHIYDDDGQLVWSGSHLTNHLSVVDFKPLILNGETVLSMQFTRRRKTYILDSHYRVKRTVDIGKRMTMNTHDFMTVEGGEHILHLRRAITEVTRDVASKELGFDGACKVGFPEFIEKDATTNATLFEWNAMGHIPLSETTWLPDDLQLMCETVHDYMHSNSVDKFKDGHYLLSARHTDTIYKISKVDGSVIWRLHGSRKHSSDFDMIGLNFSRQHDARIHEHNDTHAIITLLDNAVGGDEAPASNKFSRALQVALRFDTTPMRAELVSAIDQPRAELVFRRGNHQLLPNGNAFVGWSERGLHSEHTSNGQILMEAQLEIEPLGTYRAFKFPFIGEPDYPPDIHAAASTTGGQTTTRVYVSWNGATEVKEWILYKTDRRSQRVVELARSPRSGFESALTHSGFAKYVYVAAMGRDGKLLDFGKSNIVETDALAIQFPDAAVDVETAWLKESSTGYGLDRFTVPTFAYTAELVIAVIVALFAFKLGLNVLRRSWKAIIISRWETAGSAYPRVHH